MIISMLARSWYADVLRMRTDPLTPGFLVAAVLLAAALRFGAGGSTADGLLQAATLPVFYATIRHCRDLRTGAFVGAVLRHHRAAAFAASATTAAIMGAVVAVVGGISALVLADGVDDGIVPTMAACALCGVANALLGTCVAVVVRHYMIAPFAVAALYVASILLVEAAPAFGAMTPLGSTMTVMSVDLPESVPQPLAFSMLALWSLVVVLLAGVDLARRDV